MRRFIYLFFMFFQSCGILQTHLDTHQSRVTDILVVSLIEKHDYKFYDYNQEYDIQSHGEIGIKRRISGMVHSFVGLQNNYDNFWRDKVIDYGYYSYLKSLYLYLTKESETIESTNVGGDVLKYFRGNQARRGFSLLLDKKIPILLLKVTYEYEMKYLDGVFFRFRYENRRLPCITKVIRVEEVLPSDIQGLEIELVDG